MRSMVIGEEDAFAMDGQVNTHKIREYVPVGQPPSFHCGVNLSQQKLTVWLGLYGSGQVIGPFSFDRNVNGLNYLHTINNDVLPQLQVHFARQIEGAFRHLWWAQGGAQAHCFIAVRERLREYFVNRVISFHNNVEWPQRSPDLTTCDFFLWGYLKNKVFPSPRAELDELRNRIRNEVDILRSDFGMVRRAVQGMLRRSHLCVETDGGHVEGVGA